MEFLLTLTFIVLFLIYLIPTRQERAKKYNQSAHSASQEEIDNQLADKFAQLNYLTQMLQNNTLNNRTSLTPILENVLDQYQRANIQLPSNIIEEAALQLWTSETEIITFIEQQRNHWKLECQKKGLK